jgi:hypothetical protein
MGKYVNKARCESQMHLQLYETKSTLWKLMEFVSVREHQNFNQFSLLRIEAAQKWLYEECPNL